MDAEYLNTCDAVWVDYNDERLLMVKADEDDWVGSNDLTSNTKGILEGNPVPVGTCTGHFANLDLDTAHQIWVCSDEIYRPFVHFHDDEWVGYQGVTLTTDQVTRAGYRAMADPIRPGEHVEELRALKYALISIQYPVEVGSEQGFLDSFIPNSEFEIRASKVLETMFQTNFSRTSTAWAIVAATYNIARGHEQSFLAVTKRVDDYLSSAGKAISAVQAARDGGWFNN